MDATVLAGIKLLVPYLAGAIAVLVAVGVLGRVLRGPIAGALAAISPGGSARDGLVRCCLLIALALLAFLAAIELLAAAAFTLGVSLGPATVALAAAVAALASYLAVRALVRPGRVWQASAAVTLTTLALVGLALFAAGRFYDISWDGNWYHQQAVASVANGWNPIDDPHGTTVEIGEWAPDRSPEGIWEFAVVTYAKGGWVREAGLYSVTGSIEQAKAANLFLLAVALAVWLALSLRVFVAGLVRPVVVAALAVMNPVIVVQLLTFKNDTQVGSLFTIAVGLGCLAVGGVGGWPAALALACALMMLATVKFTGLVYAVLLATAFATAYYWRKRADRPLRVVAPWLGALLIATLLAGFNPYVTNTLEHGHPFYPLMGPDAIDSTSPEWPAASWPNNFKDAGSLERLARSLFSRAADEVFIEPGGADAELKWPFTVSTAEIRPYMGVDTRVAGFGPLFGGALVVALLLLITLVHRQRGSREPVVAAGLGLAALLLVTVLVNPEAWWARYAPQMWLVPVVLAAMGLRSARRTVPALLAVAVAAVLVLNGLFVETVNFANHLNGTHEITSALDEIEQWRTTVVLDQGDFAVSWLKLEERGIPWRLLQEGETPPDDGLTIPYTTVTAYSDK